LHAQVLAAFFHFAEVFLVGGFVLEELVDVFHGVNAVVFLGRLGEVQVVELLAKNGFVQRPFGQRQFEQRLLVIGREQKLASGSKSNGQGAGRNLEEVATIEHGMSPQRSWLCWKASDLNENNGAAGIAEIVVLNDLGFGSIDAGSLPNNEPIKPG